MGFLLLSEQKTQDDPSKGEVGRNDIR